MKKLLSSVVILFVAVMLIATPVLATAENATAVPAQEGTIATEKQILETDNATKFAQMKEEFKSREIWFSNIWSGSFNIGYC